MRAEQALRSCSLLTPLCPALSCWSGCVRKHVPRSPLAPACVHGAYPALCPQACSVKQRRSLRCGRGLLCRRAAKGDPPPERSRRRRQQRPSSPQQPPRQWQRRRRHLGRPAAPGSLGRGRGRQHQGRRVGFSGRSSRSGRWWLSSPCRPQGGCGGPAGSWCWPEPAGPPGQPPHHQPAVAPRQTAAAAARRRRPGSGC